MPSESDLKTLAENCNRVAQLERRFVETSDHLRGKLEDSRFEQAKRRVAVWKADVQTLRTTIAQQLQFCKSLRESNTLATMMTEAPAELARKRGNQMVNTLKADIRLLHDAIARHVLSDNYSKHEAKLDDAELDGLHHMRNVFEDKSQLEQRTSALEQRLKCFTAAPVGSRPVPMNSLFDLFDLYRDMQEELSSHVIATKLALDSHMGAEFELNRGSAAVESQASRCSIAYLQVVETALDMTTLVRHTKMVQDGVHRAEALAKLESEKDEMAAELISAIRRVNTLEKSLEAIKTGESVRGSGRDKILLDEAQHKITKLEREFVAMRERNVELSAQHAHAEDACARLQTEVEEQKRQHSQDTAWYAPRVEKLESMVLATASAFDAMSLDIELISDMYKRVVGELDAHTAKTSVLKEERDALAMQLTRAIKKVTSLKLENERKNKVSTAMMGARHEIMTSMDNTRNEMGSLKEELTQQKIEKRELEETCKGVERELRECKEALQGAERNVEDLRKEARSMKNKLQRFEAEKIALEASHEERIHALKAAGMDATMQEEFEEMRLRLDESMRAQSLLEGMLKKAERSNDSLNRQLADVRRAAQNASKK